MENYTTRKLTINELETISSAGSTTPTIPKGVLAREENALKAKIKTLQAQLQNKNLSAAQKTKDEQELQQDQIALNILENFGG